MPSYNIAEKFVSINGEGRRAGQLAVFIRFFWLQPALLLLRHSLGLAG